jgi:hypothetical protein
MLCATPDNKKSRSYVRRFDFSDDKYTNMRATAPELDVSLGENPWI